MVSLKNEVNLNKLLVGSRAEWNARQAWHEACARARRWRRCARTQQDLALLLGLLLFQATPLLFDDDGQNEYSERSSCHPDAGPSELGCAFKEDPCA